LGQRAKRIARLMARVAEGVHYAHQHRLLHRDLKPANILLHGPDHPYVADFGLVMRVDEEGETGRVEGTPPYMAPEQARGVAALSKAVDIYGLGAVLYELLTGQPPFTGKSKREILEKVRTQQPVAPSVLQPRVPRDLEAICMKCLQKEPSNRYASARHLARALDCFVEGKPVPGARTSRRQRIVKWVRRKPALAGLIAALIGGMAIGVSAAISGYRSEVAARQKAERDLYISSLPEAERYLSSGHVDRAAEVLDQCPPGLRDFEWYLLRRWCQPDAIILPNRRGAITGIASNLADGRLIAIACADGTVTLWNAATGEQLSALEEHRKGTASLSSSQDGCYLAVAGKDGTSVWDFTTDGYKKVLEVEGELAAVTKDGSKVATAGNDDKVRIYDRRSRLLTLSLAYDGQVGCM